MAPHIHIAFRFHVNFYHSYRGDTPDELGFGKDIRIIRQIIETLDKLNGDGIPVRGTWDFENYFSLEKIMPAHCPELIEQIQGRALSGRDEIQLMSYNNGLVSAHTAQEFEAAIRRGVTNSQGSGLRDLFGASFFAMVRPQEMMYTPMHLKLYRACGIEAISLYYSALPFNGFSCFVPKLSLAERYNPLTLEYPGIEESMTLMPCYNHGDIADHLSLPRWVRAMRKEQMAMEASQDLMLLIDMDADDAFWAGFDVPVLRGRFSTIGGLDGLVRSVAGMDFVTFSTPGDYLEKHAPVKTIWFGQDTADGSFDGMASWAEKWSNQQLWTGLERARILALQTQRMGEKALPAAATALLETAFEARLKLLSTTHFGMAAPVMNLSRERIAADLGREALEAARAAWEQTAWKPETGRFSLADYVRGDSTDLVRYEAHRSRGLIRLALQANAPEAVTIKASTGENVPAAVMRSGEGREVIFVAEFAPRERKDFVIEAAPVEAAPPQAAPIHGQEAGPGATTRHMLGNEALQVNFDPEGQVLSIEMDGFAFGNGQFLRSAVTYGGQHLQVERWEIKESFDEGMIRIVRMQGKIALPNRQEVRLEREILLAAGLPYLYLRMRVDYPLTPNYRFEREKARRLGQGWDSRWREVIPCEINPGLAGQADRPLRVWKHNYFDHTSQYDLDYGRFSRNFELDSANNQITHGWAAVSDGERGILVAQNADVLSSMAFCPLRTRRQGNLTRVSLNPFGSYSGKQYYYETADTGLGKWLTTTFSAADHLQPYAPSYNGRTQEFSLLIAPYSGDAPPDMIQYDAEAFAYPYLVITDGQILATPAHRTWCSKGIGEDPQSRKNQ